MERTASIADAEWQPLYRAGGVAALLSAALLPIQVIIFITWPPPDTVIGYFTLFQRNWLLGLLSLDLLYLVQNTLLILIYLGLYAALKRAAESYMTIALALGLVGIAAYFASGTAFEMPALSNQYAAAATEAERAGALAAGQGLLATYKGTAFDVYYVLNAAVLLIIAPVMLRSRIFTRATAYAGLLAGVLMAVPSTAGAIGVVFALASLAPWAVFTVLVDRRLFDLRQGSRAAPGAPRNILPRPPTIEGVSGL